MTTALHFLSEWASEGAWKMYVLNKLITNIDIDSAQLLTDVLKLMGDQHNNVNTLDSETQRVDEVKLIIKEIKNPININALSKDVSFSLGKNLNVFYGENGSGKSSYIRMFRKLADNYYTVEKNLSIIPNVYEASDKTIDKSLQTVEVTYTLNEDIMGEVVNLNNPHSDLKRMNVFDSDSVTPLISNDLSFTVLPRGFELFQKVSNQLDALRTEVTHIIEQEKNRQASLFVDSSFNFVRKELETIMTELQDAGNIKMFLDNNYVRPESYEETIAELDRQIKDLESANPRDKITILSTQKSKLESLLLSIKKLGTTLSQENIEKINKLIMDYEQKLQEERIYNESFQKSISFLDVVNNEWLSFISGGKNYYDSIRKVDILEGEPCIFCSHPYDKTRAELVKNHFKHVSKSNKGAQEYIENELLQYDITKITISMSEDEATFFESKIFLERIKSSIKLINRNKELFSEFLKSKHIISNTVVLNVTDLIQEITQEISNINQRIENLKKDEVDINKIINSKKTTREMFQKNEKIHASIDILLEWFKIRDSVAEYDKVQKKFNTTKLTQKQSEAFKAIVQQEYVETFERFARDLRIPNVKLKLNSQKGKTLRNKYVASEEYKVTAIMSEGEQKAIAMAEFATDLIMRRNQSTVLFDDPVTSLDYKRSELIAKLIYQISLDRQVLVFTHNIMFYYYLYNECKKPKNYENKFFRVDEYDKLNKGVISESFSGRLETLKEVTGKLKRQKQELNSNVLIGDELEEGLKKAYGDIRTWCELIIEEGFFNSVIRRYEPNIMFTRVKGIKGEFVNELDSVNELFERSSRWMSGHSQPTETQNARANREAFNRDVDYIVGVYERFHQD